MVGTHRHLRRPTDPFLPGLPDRRERDYWDVNQNELCASSLGPEDVETNRHCKLRGHCATSDGLGTQLGTPRDDRLRHPRCVPLLQDFSTGESTAFSEPVALRSNPPAPHAGSGAIIRRHRPARRGVWKKVVSPSYLRASERRDCVLPPSRGRNHHALRSTSGDRPRRPWTVPFQPRWRLRR